MNIALIGAAGYVAPRHMRAIKETGHDLVAIIDPNDSVGIIDSIAPQAELFLDTDACTAWLRATQTSLDYLAVTSPNHLHLDHIAYGLSLGAKVICEKPLTIHTNDLDQFLVDYPQAKTDVCTILQTRLHPSIIALKQRIEALPAEEPLHVTFTTVTPRGRWYHTSWKGDINKSGGIAANIGIHFFDMLMWIFGSVQKSVVYIHDNERAAGTLTLGRATVDWYLSIDKQDLPQSAIDAGHPSFRSIIINGEEVEYSGGFTDLHTTSYQEIFAGRGFHIDLARPSIALAESIRTAPQLGQSACPHPFAKQ
jgi:UDP-N-acetyl-2-amino-2-deoxyglucuronate dehydrogenase